MKLLLSIFAAAALTLTGCGAEKAFSTVHNYVKNNCVASDVSYDPKTGLSTAYYECFGLFEWKEGKKHVKAAKLCIDPINGSVSGSVTYDSTSTISKLYGKK